MDYDDNDAQDQNLHLVGEASDKVSPALRSYNLPKFEFDDSLQGHLRFDNLVDNDVFLGITGQEDNQWIEEYSRGTSAIQFSSSAVELTSKNVWSEATSSESVEMLLKSVGQEDMVLEETIVKDLDACDRPDSLTKDMDPSLKQCDTMDHSINSDNVVVPDESHENSVAIKVSSDCEQSQKSKNSGGELDSVVKGSKYDSSLGVEEVDNLQNDVTLDAGTIAERGDTGSSDNLVASIKECEENRQEVPESGSENAGGQSKDVNDKMENNVENSTISSTVVGTCTYSVDQVSAVQNVESLDKPSFEDTMHVDEEPIVSLLSESSDMQIDEEPGKDNNVNTEEELSAASPNGGCVEMQATEDANTTSEMPHKGPGNELNNTMLEESLAALPNSGCVDVQTTDHANTKSEIPDEGTGKELNDNMQEEVLAASPNGGCVEMQATEDAHTKSGMPDSPISNVGSHVQNHSVETENVVGGNGQNVTSGTSLVEGSDINNAGTTSTVAGSSAEMPAEDLSNNASEVQTEDTSNAGSHAQSHSVETENVIGASLVDGSDTSIVAGSSAEIPAEALSNNASKVQTEDTNNVGSDVQSYSVETTNVVGLDDEHFTSGTSLVDESGTSNVGTTSIAAGTAAERSAEDISNNASEVQTEDTNNEDLHLPAKLSGLVEVDDEPPSSEPDGVTMDQDVTLHEGRDAKLPSDFRDTDMDDTGAPDSQKDVKARTSDSNMAVITDAVAVAQSSNISSPDTAGGVQTLTGIVATDDYVTEDQPRSPILGVSLLHTDNQEKVEVGLSDKGSSQNATQGADSTADFALDDPLPLAEKGRESNVAEHVVHELSGHCDPPVETLNVSISEQTAEEPPVENMNASKQTSESDPGSLKCSNALETTLPCVSSVEHGNKEKGGMLDPKESKSSEDGVESLGVNVSEEQRVSVDIAEPSACNTNLVVQNGGGSLLDKPQSISSEPFQIAKDTIEVTTDTFNENASLTTVSNDRMDLQSVSSSVARTEEKSFTFEVSASPVSRQTGTQNLGLSKVSSTNLHKDSLVSPQTPSSAANEVGAKGNSVPKPRRRSAAKETANKDTPLKEKTPRRRGRAVDKSPAGHVMRIEETTESVKSSRSKFAGTPISTSNLPDLNNLTSQFQQSFTDNQQVQLRAQILVYGSLISGMAPEESHMFAAFGQSDGGKKAWEAAWHGCLERVRGQKSQTPNSSTPMKSPSGNKDPVGSTQSKVVSGISSSIISPMIPISSPLWNISTPGDYRQTPSPLHPYRTPPVQNVAGNNPAWLSQGPFPGQWAAASPIAPFSARFSALPITEAVKLTTVKESGASGTSVVPVDPSPGPLVSTNQPTSDSKSRKRKKVTASQDQVTPSSAPVAHLLQAPRTEDHNKNLFLAQSQTNLGTALVVSDHSAKSAAALSTPVSIISKSNLGHPSGTDQSVEKIVRREENVSKIEESKLQAADAALQAADAVSHCQGVWSQLERQKNSGLVSDDEAKLASSAVSIAAAASVAKVAAAAARIASNVAEQARLMADEVFLSSRNESHGESGIISHDKAMSSDHPSSIISAAREAARKRIEAASAASKHAENLDAIVKAAELAAEAVSQAGKIVAMGNPMSLTALVEAGPEGYWKTHQSSNPQSSNKQIVEVASNNKGCQSLKHGSTLQEDSGDLVKSQMMLIDSISGSTTSYKNGKSIARGQKGPELAKAVALVPEPEAGSVRTSDVDQNMPQSTSGSSKENVIKEGCLVEVYKDDHKNNGAWFAANVMTLKDGKAFVCYTEIQSDQGQYKEWVPLEVDNTQAPKIRIAHPLTTMRPEGTRKRGRTALADSYFSGDRVDVWVQNRWCEAVVLETNKIDLTSLTVKFPANGETSIVRSWHVRPSHIWKDGKWIEWSSLKGCRSSEDDAPVEKRQKFGSPIVEGHEKDTFSIDLVGPRQQESNILPFSTQESSFDIGKSSRNEDKLDTRGAMKSSLKKERSRVVFGVPKPGKKQKFMDVRTQHVADRSTKNNTPNDSVNFASSMIPQAPGRRTPKSNLKNDAEEKQVAEVRSRTQRLRKPPVPSVRSLAQKDRSKSSKSTSHDAISADENMSSNTEDAKGTSSSKAVYQRLNKAITTPGDRKALRGEVKEQPTSEVEIRRSNRKIQPTSRMLEGLQSSLSVSKIPSASHASQRSHNKVTSKGGSNPS